MKILTYSCPSCGEKVVLNLLSDKCVCKSCKCTIQLTPNFSSKRYFLPLILLISLTIGHFLGHLRAVSNEEFGLASLIFDVVLFYFCYWIIRIVLFQFQTPELLSSMDVTQEK